MAQDTVHDVHTRGSGGRIQVGRGVPDDSLTRSMAGYDDRPDRRVPVGAVCGVRGVGPGVGQARVAMAWLKVADGRMTAAALVTSGW